MNSNKKPFEKSAGTKPDKKSAKIARPSFPEERQNGEAGSIAKRGNKSSTSGNSSAFAHIEIPALNKLIASNEGLKIFELIFASVRESMLVLDGDLRVVSANRSFYEFFKVKPKETIGNLVYDIGDQQWRIPALRTLLETILPKKTIFNNYEVEHEFPGIGRRILLLNARKIRLPSKETQLILLAFEDVTERVRLERTLQASEQRFRRAFETAHDGMLLIEKTDGQIVNSNQAVQDMLGYSDQELLEKNIWEIGLQKNHGHFKQTALELEEHGIGIFYNTTIKHKEGGRFPADVYLMNRAAVFQCNIRDITAHKRIIDELKNNEKKYFNLVDQSPEGLFLIESSGKITSVNKAMCRELAFSQEELLSMSIWDIIPEQYLDQYRKRLTKKLQGKQLGKVAEYVVSGKDGKYHYVEILSAPHYSGEGIVGFQGIARDVTTRKKAEEELRESKALLETVVENIPLMIFLKEAADLRFVLFNKAGEELMGYDRKVLLGKNNLDLFPPEQAVHFMTKDREVLDGEAGVLDIPEEPILTSKKGPRLLHTRKVCIRGADGTMKYLLGISEDITERKQAEQKLAQYSEQLEEMVEDRTRELRDAQEKLVRHEKLATLGELAGSVSHELRNPLGVISNAVYFLKLVQPEANEKIRQYHTMIEKETDNAEKIIADLLDFARLKSMERELVSVPALVQSVLNRYPVPALVKVALKLPPGLPMVFADPRQMEQVLGNLVMNAYQAMAPRSSAAGVSKAARLTISACVQEQMVAIAVKDNGVGIPPENMAKLFEPLFTTKSKGIGLGLPISQKLAEANGGRIQVESLPGKGSTFTLVLPVQEVKQ